MTTGAEALDLVLRAGLERPRLALIVELKPIEMAPIPLGWPIDLVRSAVLLSRRAIRTWRERAGRPLLVFAVYRDRLELHQYANAGQPDPRDTSHSSGSSHHPIRPLLDKTELLHTESIRRVAGVLVSGRSLSVNRTEFSLSSPKDRDLLITQLRKPEWRRHLAEFPGDAFGPLGLPGDDLPRDFLGS